MARSSWLPYCLLPGERQEPSVFIGKSPPPVLPPALLHGCPPCQRAAPSAPSPPFLPVRATWFENPYTGSCGYGKLDGCAYGYDAVAAMPDVSPDYPTSCGRWVGCAEGLACWRESWRAAQGGRRWVGR